MAPIPIAKRVASYKVKNPQKVKISKLKEYASIAQKRLSDKFYDDQYKAKERDRKRRQRALKKKEISKPHLHCFLLVLPHIAFLLYLWWNLLVDPIVKTDQMFSFLSHPPIRTQNLMMNSAQ